MNNLPGSLRPETEDDSTPDERHEHYMIGVDQEDQASQPVRSAFQRNTAPASMAILVACIAVFVLSVMLKAVPEQYLVFSPGNGLVFPGIITHMFAHANTMHLLGNMLVLFFLGTIVEQSYGTSRFLVLYLVSGLLAALAEAVVAPTGLLLGASGALAGVMAAFVRHYPKTMLYVYGILPVPAWLFIVLWIGYNLWGASGGMDRSIAFWAHLAGFAAGMVLSFLIIRPGKPGVFVRQLP